MIDLNRFSNKNKLLAIVDAFEKNLPADYLELLTNVLSFDDSSDLTEIKPKDRTNITLYHGLLFSTGDDYFPPGLQNTFKDSIDLAKNLQGLTRLEIIAVGPKSIVPLHLDDMSRQPFDLNDWYVVLLGIKVPSTDSQLLGMEINEKIYNHMLHQALIFDTQVPHQAWNHTSDWWLMLRFSLLKSYFTHENINT